jgi:hypothetical protein
MHRCRAASIDSTAENPHNVKRMGDAQLLRVVARGTPDPAAFLAMSEEQQDEVIDELLRSDKIWPS